MSLGYVLLVLVIYVLTVASLTRLVNYDVIFDPVRVWVAKRGSRAHTAAVQAADAQMQTEYDSAMTRYRRWTLFADFLACPWCVSPWIAGVTVTAPIIVIGWPWWTFPWIVFATRHLVGIGDRWVSEHFEIVDDQGGQG